MLVKIAEAKKIELLLAGWAIDSMSHYPSNKMNYSSKNSN